MGIIAPLVLWRAIAQIDTATVAMTDDEIYQKMVEIAACYGILKCEECADAMKEWLNKNKINGVKIKISSNYQFIITNRWKKGVEPITQNGIHYGIEVRGKVFDNLPGSGLSRQAWISSFVARDPLSVAE